MDGKVLPDSYKLHTHSQRHLTGMGSLLNLINIRPPLFYFTEKESPGSKWPTCLPTSGVPVERRLPPGTLFRLSLLTTVWGLSC